ncbi:hypothetical protein HHK36_008446 [Tetracentron sinense]|uniref:Kinesin motor domain-containing protein n=1 Tax=Tetracentron sinense TaxID=13715 RepID=A0A834ZFF4_TETSI|nr:hypothetical protein HHK36_008446 [Tetracentron sinense]
MLRDLKIFRRNSGKNSTVEEIENVPVNPTDPLSIQIGTDATRAPLITIQEPTQSTKSVPEQEAGPRSKVDRTPSKVKGKASDATLPLRTPDKQGLGISARNRFGWGQKSEACSNGTETRDDVSHGLAHLPPSSRGANLGNGGFMNMTPRSTRTTGRATSNYSESNSTQSTPTKSVTKPPNPGFAPLSASRAPVSVGTRGGNFSALSKGVPISCVPPSIVNTIEVPHFELREDPSFWMDHNVQVLIRVRPLNSMERSSQGYSRCLKQESAQSIAWIGQPETRFTFDHVACETVSQEMLFRVAGLPMVENCLSGYNSCMFAYGQTGSGKTYTMLGEIDELEVKPSPNRGMTPRIFEFLFARIRAEEESRRDERLKYNCKCSFLEIYNEQITDLLDPSSTNLLLREDIKTGVYVENLTEFEVQTVNDILKLLTQGAANRKVAATNMNRESSRSHSVFTCVIESRWEKDSTANLRFARLNLVDLAGSERQKTSGAEGERLKEAANINKSLSTLGHVIMVLVDVAHGKQKHVPYRDSRLTFLLQDSLGGNSKTMVIANVSPSICCAAETLSTLKFAQRAKLIQNNAVVNEDASGDVIALQHQIRFLKEELSVLKRQNVSRSLSFCTDAGEHDTAPEETIPEVDHRRTDDFHGSASSGVVRLSTKQFKSLETTLAGALRREQMADTSIKQLEAEIEQLNRLVRQREEDTRCTKMMLRFREDKIQRMESLLGGLMPSDTYLVEENSALSEEIQLLRAKVDRNPEVTRFALENIRLLDQLRRFQDFYDGEREILVAEVSELRDQLVQFLDGNTGQHNHSDLNVPRQEAAAICSEKDSFHLELENTLKDLEDCRNNLNSCLESNAKLSREIDDLHSQLNNLKSTPLDRDGNVEPQKDCLTEDPSFRTQLLDGVQKEKAEWKHETLIKHTEEIMNLQLELDILKIILKEERSSQGQIEERVLCLNRDLELAKEKCLLICKQWEDAKDELKDARSVIEALESQQFITINELEDLRDSNSQYVELLSKQEQEISVLKGQLCTQDLRDQPPLKHSENEDSPLQAKLKRMQDSLEKAKRLNMWYQSDQAFQTSHEQEMDEVRRQVEAETAEVIVCLQEELATLQQQIEDCNEENIETKKSLILLETESKELQERLYLTTQDNEKLGEILAEKDKELRGLSKELEKLSCEIEEVLADGHEALKDASDQLDLISSSFPQRRTWIGDQVGRMIRTISEKELLIEELQRCLEDAHNRRSDMEWMLRSLRGAALAISEAQNQESSEKEKEVLLLSSQLGAKSSTITKLGNRIKLGEDQIRNTNICATAAFVIVNRLYEVNSNYLDALKHKDLQLNESIGMNLKKDALLHDQAAVIEEVEKQIQDLRLELEASEESSSKLRMKLSEEQEYVCAMERKLEENQKDDLLKTREKLDEFKSCVSTLNSCMNEYSEQVGGPETEHTPKRHVCTRVDGDNEGRTETETTQDINNKEPHFIEVMTNDMAENSFKVGKNVKDYPCDLKNLESGRTCKDVYDRDITIILLRKEIESALESLKGVQSQMTKLLEEKEEFRKSEQHSRKSMECLADQALTLQAEINNIERKSDLKLMELDNKLWTLEETAQEASICWCLTKEVFVLELIDAKIIAAQKTAEASCLLTKFEEVQETMKEADVMVNALVTANEKAKLEIERLKKMEATLINERELLINEIRSLQSSKDLKDQQYDSLEKEFSSNLSETRIVVLALEDIITHAQTTFKEGFMSIVCDLHCLKSQLLHSTNLMRSCLEDIWSEIIIKDCAVSVLHLCHMGILLETVTGLNAENGLLHYGLCESNSVIADLRDHNSKSKKELEMCRILKGKLLSDIKNSFDRIMRNEDTAGKLSVRLTSFERKILDLQLQEESMLSRSNSMGSELSILMKELDTSNSSALITLLDQEKLLKDKEEVIKSQSDSFMIELSAKDFESLFLISELKQMAHQNADLERKGDTSSVVIENIKKELIFLIVDAELEKQLFMDKEVEVALLQKEIEEANSERQDLSLKLTQSNLRISQINKVNKALERDIQSLKEVSCSNDTLKDELNEVMEAKARLSIRAQKLETENEGLLEDLEIKETALKSSSCRISLLDIQNQKLQNDMCLMEASCCRLQTQLDMKDAELKKMSCIEEENESLKNDSRKLKDDHFRVLEDLQEKESKIESSVSHMHVFDLENHRLQEKILSLENYIASLLTHLNMRNAELEKLRQCQSVTGEELSSKTRDLEIHTNRINALEEEIGFLRTEFMSLKRNKDEVLSILSLNLEKCVDLVEAVDMKGHRIFEVLTEKSVALLDEMSQEIRKHEDRASKFIAESECLEHFAKELISENMSLQSELLRKEEISDGLLFDLSLLQESASNAKDRKDNFEEMEAALESLEDNLAVRSSELEEAVVHCQMLEAQLQEKINMIYTLELDISKERESLKMFLDENLELRAQMEDLLVTKSSIEEELTERKTVTERLEEELFEMSNALSQMNNSIEGYKCDLNEVTRERDHIDSEVLILKEKLELEQALAEENEAIAMEARQIAESRKVYAEDKEEEVKLLERSVEELECTVNVLENKVDVVKGEAERQRLQREELEMELHAIRHQMLSVHTSDVIMESKIQNVKGSAAELQRLLNEKEKELQETQKHLKNLEKNMTEKNTEIAQCKAHMSELNLHAEAQAREYKQKFKALEAMAEQVKYEAASTHVANSLSTKPEKNAAKSRGSGSPFKCIGLGLTQQINSEKDEELTAGKLRIEELEALAASRQKEIFMLNARLAAAESMTHDVIRDLLGVKLDMTSYASLLDHQQVQNITEKAQLHSESSVEKDPEVVKLKQQLNEFIEERQGWLEEIDRKHAEMVAARFALEKLRQRDQFLTTENEKMKIENVNHKKKVMELEDEVNMLSGQQNLQQRIHHHAKIKADLSAKLRRVEAILSRVKEELARYRASSGRSPCIDFDEEQRLNNKLKAAGITPPVSDKSLSVAEEALDQLKDRVTSLERELQDLKFKSRISGERIRLSELKPQSSRTSPLSSRIDENHPTPRRVSQTPFLSALSR